MSDAQILFFPSSPEQCERLSRRSDADGGTCQMYYAHLAHEYLIDRLTKRIATGFYIPLHDDRLTACLGNADYHTNGEALRAWIKHQLADVDASLDEDALLGGLAVELSRQIAEYRDEQPW